MATGVLVRVFVKAVEHCDRAEKPARFRSAEPTLGLVLDFLGQTQDRADVVLEPIGVVAPGLAGSSLHLAAYMREYMRKYSVVSLTHLAMLSTSSGWRRR